MEETKQELGAKEDVSVNKRPTEIIKLEINFSKKGGKLSKQLKAQGFKFDKKFIKGIELIRIDILALDSIEILSKEAVRESLKRLNNLIAEHVINQTYDGVKSIQLAEPTGK